MNIRAQIGAGMIPLVAMIALACDEDVTAPVGPTVGSIVLQLEADTLSVDQTTQLQATVLSVEGDTLSDETVTFLSSDDDIVSVSGTGLVTAEGSGTATITAGAADRTSTVTVYVRRAASISVAPSDPTLVVEERLTLAVTVLDSDGAPIANPVLGFTSSNYDVVDVGLDEDKGHYFIAAYAVGDAVITFETEGLGATVEVRVDPSEVGSVLLLPDSLVIAAGDTARLTVIVRDTTGAVIADPHVVFQCPRGFCRWGEDGFANIDTTGLVTGHFAGSDEVIARSKGVNSNTIYLTVE